MKIRFYDDIVFHEKNGAVLAVAYGDGVTRCSVPALAFEDEALEYLIRAQSGEGCENGTTYGEFCGFLVQNGFASYIG